MLKTEEAMQVLQHYPEYSKSLRNLPNEERYHLLEDITRFFTTLNVHIDLERRFSRVIRVGYIERNPMKSEYWNKSKKRTKRIDVYSFDQYGLEDTYHSTSAYGFNMVGISGIGKSQAVERILRLYPQIIHHKKFRRRNFTYSQIVWLKLDCPFDGSLKGLCINFFQAVDSILGTRYHKNYGSRYRTTDEMIPSMALVAANHALGVLVIDEIQRLSLAKSGGGEKMLNFFVQLVNSVGVPVVLVGTYKSLSVFEGNFSQMRRGTGQGDLVWDRMSLNDEWKLFVKALWQFQYTNKTFSLEDNPEIIEVLYEETQGITDLAVKAYMFAQERAIETGKEMVTAAIIRSVCRDKFRMMRLALKALKAKNKNALARFEDAYPRFLGDYLEHSSQQYSQDNKLVIEGEISSSPEIRNKIDKKESSEISKISEKKTSLMNIEIWAKKSNKKKNQKNYPKTVLPEIHTPLDKINKVSAYTKLSQAGFICSAGEFVKSYKE